MLAKTFDCQVVRGAMVLLAISAVAPLLPAKLLKLGIDPSYDATVGGLICKPSAAATPGTAHQPVGDTVRATIDRGRGNAIDTRLAH